jgi:hypothetical protein
MEFILYMGASLEVGRISAGAEEDQWEAPVRAERDVVLVDAPEPVRLLG